MNNTIPVAFRIDRQLKENAVSVLDGLGLDLTTAIKMYLSKVVIQNGIPFSVDYESRRTDIPNEETLSAFKWTEDYIGKGKKNGFKTSGELFNHLGI
jgi:DNA-damage-inducible protein J